MNLEFQATIRTVFKKANHTPIFDIPNKNLIWGTQ